MKPKPHGARYLSNLVRHVRGSSPDGPVVEILLERADRILAADGGRDCKRALTDAEIDLLLAGDQPEGAAGGRPARRYGERRETSILPGTRALFGSLPTTAEWRL